MMKFSVSPGYVRKKAPAKPKLDPFILVNDGILRDDKSRPKKQQHTSKRIFERLRDEHGFTGGIPIVKDYVAGWWQRRDIRTAGASARARSGRLWRGDRHRPSCQHR